MINPSKFVNIIRQKVIPLPLQTSNKSIPEEPVAILTDKQTRYIGIDNEDLYQRVQHTIRNLMELDDEELEYIEDMNCRNMFKIVVLLNKVVATLVENMMAME
jgi:hypothetical protein